MIFVIRVGVIKGSVVLFRAANTQMLDEAFHQIDSIKYINPFAESAATMYFCLYIPALSRLQFIKTPAVSVLLTAYTSL